MSTSTIDPRIRERRIAVQRDVGRRRLQRLAVAGAASATLAAAWGITLTPLLDVDHLRVAGAGRTGEQAILDATGIARGDALLTADLGAAAERIAELPWVQTAEVHREWPGTLRVDVVEREVAAAVPAEGGGWLLLDREGRQLAAAPEPAPGVLRIEVAPIPTRLGRPSGSEAAGPALALASTVPSGLRERLVVLREAPGGTVEGVVRLEGDAEALVRFGRPTQAAAKWYALLSILEDADLGGRDTIDLRVPSAPALTRG